jgi:GTP cyclohydrolase I
MSKQTPRSDLSADASPPASERIRARLKAAGQRFHANDNIAAFVQPGELDELQRRSPGATCGCAARAGDRHRERSQHPGHRAPGGQDVLERGVPRPLRAGAAVTEFPNVEQLNELMIVGPITVRSACSHHLCPIMGKVWIGVMPNEHSNLIGLSKYARLAEWVMSRPQIQEEAVTSWPACSSDMMQPDGLALVMEADHFCMHWRGVKDMRFEDDQQRDARFLPQGRGVAARVPESAEPAAGVAVKRGTGQGSGGGGRRLGGLLCVRQPVIAIPLRTCIGVFPLPPAPFPAF